MREERGLAFGTDSIDTPMGRSWLADITGLWMKVVVGVVIRCRATLTEQIS